MTLFHSCIPFTGMTSHHRQHNSTVCIITIQDTFYRFPEYPAAPPFIFTSLSLNNENPPPQLSPNFSTLSNCKGFKTPSFLHWG